MDSEDLEPRVSALEKQMRNFRARIRASERDAAAARVLAGGVDRDSGELRDEVRDFRRATTAGFNALRADMVDLRGEMTDLRGEMTDLRGEMTDLRGEMTDGFTEMRAKFDVSAAGQQRIAELIQRVLDTSGEADGN